MKIAIVGPSPVPFTFGGIESLLAGLREQIGYLTPHEVELIKVPSRERSFWELVESYRQFSSLDLSHFDLVISSKYPAWMVRHARHICYMAHPLRGLYDTYSLSGRSETVSPEHPAICRLLDFIRRHNGSAEELLPEFFLLLERLRVADVPPMYFDFPGPLIRSIIHFLDAHALAPSRIHRFFAISATVARRPDYFPKDASIQVLHPPSRLCGFREEDARWFFAPGRLESPKRIDLLVKAMRLVPADVPLKIAGTGPEDGALRRLAGGDRRIEFLGFVRDEDLIELYANALAVLFVPYDEDYGLVAIEAMMSGKPVMTCSDSGGPLEFVTDHETGLVARPECTDIAAKINWLVANRQAARTMGQKGRGKVDHVTWDSTIRALLGEEADGSQTRGAVVLGSAGGSSRDCGYHTTPARPKVTVALPFPVYPPFGGGQQRVLDLYRHVAEAFDVELVSLGEAGSEPCEARLAPGLTEIRIPRSVQHSDLEARISSMVEGVPIGDILFSLLHEHTPEYTTRLARSVAQSALVVASHPYSLPAIHACRSRQILVYEAHNVEYTLKKDALSGQPFATELLDIVRKVEAEACRTSNLILCCSEEDREELSKLYEIDHGRVDLARNGVDVGAVRFTPHPEKERLKRDLGIEGRPVALFVGSWHPPNLQAAETILELAQRIPGVTFLLAGSHCVPFAARSRPDNVVFMGTVDSDTLALMLAVADVALNPMLSGSGSNLKMALYLAAGTPVISTPRGARGYQLIDGQHALICPLEDFSARLTGLLKDQALIETLSTGGRSLVEERHDWKLIASGVIAAFQSLSRAPSGHRARDHLVSRVATGMADLGIPDRHPVIAKVAQAVHELDGVGTRRHGEDGAIGS